MQNTLAYYVIMDIFDKKVCSIELLFMNHVKSEKHSSLLCD